MLRKVQNKRKRLSLNYNNLYKKIFTKKLKLNNAMNMFISVKINPLKEPSRKQSTRMMFTSKLRII